MVKALVVAAVLAGSADANADDAQWYGWQVMTADAGCAAINYVALRHLKGPSATTVMTTCFLAPLVVHWANAGRGAAFKSLGLRTGAALVAVLALGAEIASNQKGSNNGSSYFPWFTVAVAAGALSTDYFVLARKSPAPEPLMIGISVAW